MAEFDPATINYGLDNEAYLTDEQKKLARMIQGKFDASMQQRDRELARYNAPRVSSFIEDEALARAMTMAREFNTQNDPLGLGINQGGGGGRSTGGGGGGSGGGAGRALYPNDGIGTPRQPARSGANAQTPGGWQNILSGLTSLAPLLFGKNAFGQFMNDGLIKTVKNAIFGPEVAATISPEAFEQIVTQGGFPTQGPMTLNPFTGQPMAIDPNWTPGGLGDPYGAGSGWGQDVIQTPAPDWNPDAFNPDAWQGGDWGAAPPPYYDGMDAGQQWGGPWEGEDLTPPMWEWGGWDDGGGAGYVDYFGGV